MAEIRAPLCPGCGSAPTIALDRQFWCGSEQCSVLVWDPLEDPARFKANARVIDLSVFDNLCLEHVQTDDYDQTDDEQQYEDPR